MAFINALFSSDMTLSLQEAFQGKDTTSDEMRKNIQDCYDIYYGGDTELEDTNQKIPVVIVNKLYKAVFGEYTTYTDNEEIRKIIKKIDKNKKGYLQHLLLGGEIFLKPIVIDNEDYSGFDFALIKRDCFMPLSRDNDGNITSVGMIERTQIGKTIYTLTEKRTAGEQLTVEYKLYSSDSSDKLGKEIPLNTLNKYAELKNEVTLPLADSLGMVPVKTPIINNVDGSFDGCCIYSAALKLIHAINKNEMEINDEFQNGASRILAASSLFRKSGGKPELYDKVFMALDGTDPDETPITIFSPTLREQSYLARKREYLRNVENLIGIKHGLLADVSEEERTATEITDSKGDYALTVEDLQNTWSQFIYSLIDLCNSLSEIYSIGKISDDAASELTIDWGDGVLYNRDKVFSEMLAMVSAGILKPDELVAWYYGINAEDGKNAELIKQKMPELGNLLET